MIKNLTKKEIMVVTGGLFGCIKAALRFIFRIKPRCPPVEPFVLELPEDPRLALTKAHEECELLRRILD